MDQEENVVDREVAEQEFERFADAMDLDVDPAGMDDDDRRGFEREKRIFLRAVQAGRLVVDEAGQPVYTPKGGEPITFYEPTGATLMEMDRVKQGKAMKQTSVLLAAMTKQSPPRFANMKLRDYKVCQAIMAFFMGG